MLHVAPLGSRLRRRFSSRPAPGPRRPREFTRRSGWKQTSTEALTNRPKLREKGSVNRPFTGRLLLTALVVLVAGCGGGSAPRPDAAIAACVKKGSGRWSQAQCRCVVTKAEALGFSRSQLTADIRASTVSDPRLIRVSFACAAVK